MIVDRAGKLTTRHFNCKITGIKLVNRYMYLSSQNGRKMKKDAYDPFIRHLEEKRIVIKTKMILIRALVFPIFLYGEETWSILVRERIYAFERYC